MENQNKKFDFSMNPDDLFREESITDMKIGNIRMMVPVHDDGTKDDSRKVVYIGSAQLMSSEGPVPIQTIIDAASLKEALKKFPNDMEVAATLMMAHVEKMQATQNAQNKF